MSNNVSELSAAERASTLPATGAEYETLAMIQLLINQRQKT